MREFSRIGESVPADFALELSVCQSWILASHLAETGWQRGAKSSYPRAVLCSVHQSCPALCNFMNCSPSGSSVHGDFPRQEYWSGLPFPPSGDFPNPRTEPRSPALQADTLPSESPGKPKNTGVGSLALRQGIFLIQESNWGLLHCRQILYQLSHKRAKYPLITSHHRRWVWSW